jgi:hypothetical protein
MEMVAFLDIFHPPVLIENNVSKVGFCLRRQVKPAQLGPINRDTPYLRTPAPTQTKHSTNHLRELRQNIENIKKNPHS